MTKHSLKQMILNEIDNHPRGFTTILAKIAGYENSGGLTKVLNNEKKEFGFFKGLIDLVKFLFEDEEQSILEAYSKILNPCFQNARYMLEYLSSHRKLDAMKELIDRMLVCNNEESKEWAKFYNLQYEWQKNYYSLDREDFLKNVRKLRPVSIEMRLFQLLMNCYYYYSRENDKTAFEISQELKLELDDIKNDYMKKSFEMKVNEVQSYINLWVLNNPEASRKNADVVIESKIGTTFEAFGFYVKGCSYFFSSYDDAFSNLNESVRLYESIGRTDAKESSLQYLDRLNLFWGKGIELTESTHVENLLYSKAISKKLYKNDLLQFEDEIDKSMLFYFEGLQTNDTNILMRSVIHFLKIGNAFFANMPRLELLKRGYNEEVLDDMISMYA